MMAPGDTFPLIFYSAITHPEKTFRDKLMGSIQAWVESLEPQYSDEQIRDAIGNCTGTVLEPFVLEPEDIDYAVLLIKMAFSKKFGQTRFRLVSRETLGIEGGCVLTNNLKHYYVERFALGKRRTTPAKSWAFIPNNPPNNMLAKLRPMLASANTQSNTLEASIHADDAGYRIIIEGIHLDALKWPHSARLSGELQRNSTVGEKQESLASMGMRVEVVKGNITIQPASPESTMRLTAHLIDGDLLVLDPGEDFDGRFKIHLPISLPENNAMSIKATVTVTDNPFSEWLNVRPSFAPELSKSEKLMMAQWLLPHDSWVDREFMEDI